jgi:alpha-glucosidase (family GH31 glycosyl hydrolase)
MKNSIAGVMNFNMFGIPHSGPDTCGTFGDTTDDELCARWIQLATFFPLARLNSPMENNSEKIMPFFFNEPYNIWAFNAMRDRFRYMRHMYTCLYEASVSG